MIDAVGFLHADKHESFLQIDTNIFWWLWSSLTEVPEKASLQCLYNIPKKVRVEVDFFDVDKHQSFLTVDLKVIMKTWRTWGWQWSSILKVCKVTSLQCLYNISAKKKLRMEFSIFDVIYLFLMKVARHVQSTKKGSLLNFSNILRKSIAITFVFYCDAKHRDISLGSHHVCCYLYLAGCRQKQAWSFIMEFWNLLYLKRVNWEN